MKGVFVASIGLALFGVYCLVMSPIVRQEAEDLPRLTCDQLSKNGPGNHRYVALTDACLSGGHSVAQRDPDTGALEMYHPLYAAHLKQEPPPGELVLVLCIMDEMERRRIRDDRTERQQIGRPGLSELTGEVKSGDHLPVWARHGLKTNFPGIPLAKCRVLIVGEYEPTAARATRLLCYGIVSTVAACVLFCSWRIWRRVAPRERKAEQENQPAAAAESS
jgi:hypothetical protein